jgi:outer membrane receptor protein involved in Fe transport
MVHGVSPSRDDTVKRSALLFGLVLLHVLAEAASADARPVSGTVRAPTGGTISGARVTFETGSRHLEAVTDSQGRFSFADVPSTPFTLRVEAEGFAPARTRIEAGDSAQDIEVALHPLVVSEDVTVTATRMSRDVSDTPASVVVLTRSNLDVTAALVADDALRQVAGFSLFRRSGSRTANPTTQGVSLRGTGASGASRAVVLKDGVPLNDPFGGWIYWDRITLLAIERAEVMRGGASELYGSPALGGAIQLIRRESLEPVSLRAEASWGSLASRDGALFGTLKTGYFFLALSGEAFATGGYVPVAPRKRGTVDTSASSRHETAELTIERRTDSSRLFLRGSVYAESRQNGTPLQTNDAHIAEASAGAEGTVGDTSWTVRAYGNGQRFHQGFSAVALDRSSERLTRYQTVPADAEGLSAQAVRSLGGHVFILGVEGRRVSGETREAIPGPPASTQTAGGQEMTGAAFLGDVFVVGQAWTFTGGVRFDAWEDRDGRKTTVSSAGTISSETRFPARSESALSPRLSVLFRASPDVSLAASAYRSFRAPTLNELYRSFRVGNIVTSGNESLHPERATGGETSLVLEPAQSNLRARVTVFWMEIDDAIGNRTLSSTPALVTRRRENLGTTRSRGIELDVAARLKSWTLRGGYVLADSSVLSAPTAPKLVGLRVPQIPRQHGTLQVEYRSGRIAAAIQARGGGSQFEDDENQLPLSSFWTLDMFLSHKLSGVLEPYLAVENLLNRDVEIGRTPVTTLGPPRAARLGLRIHLRR